MHKLIERLLVFTLAACGIAACCIGIVVTRQRDDARALAARYRQSAEYYAGIVERCGFWPDESESMVGE